MPDDATILAKEAATLAAAAEITRKHGDAKTALALQQLAGTVEALAEGERSPWQWTGSAHGDTAAP